MIPISELEYELHPEAHIDKYRHIWYEWKTNTWNLRDSAFRAKIGVRFSL